MKTRLHGALGAVAWLCITAFWLSTVVSELWLGPASVAAVKNAILMGMWVLIPAMDATGGSGTSGVNPGDGRGGAVFICTANLTDSGTNQAPTQCSASFNETDSCGVTFHNDTASTGQPELFWKTPDNIYLDFDAITDTRDSHAHLGLDLSIGQIRRWI